MPANVQPESRSFMLPRSQAFPSHDVTPGTGCLKHTALAREGAGLLIKGSGIRFSYMGSVAGVEKEGGTTAQRKWHPLQLHGFSGGGGQSGRDF